MQGHDPWLSPARLSGAGAGRGLAGAGGAAGAGAGAGPAAGPALAAPGSSSPAAREWAGVRDRLRRMRADLEARAPARQL